MEKIEHLESDLYDSGVDIVRRCYGGLQGYYRSYPDGYAFIAISPHLTGAEQTSVAFHEAGHHYTMYEPNQHARNESRADRWAARKLVPPHSLIEALYNGCRNQFEVAEHLGISECFLHKTLEIYRMIYGEYLEHENWVVSFCPTLVAFNHITNQYYPD